MQTYEWVNKEKERFYKIEVKYQGDIGLALDYKWGSTISNRGGKKNVLLNSREEAQKTIEQMMKRRKSRGYELIHLND